MVRQQHSLEEKSRLVLEAVRGERTINEIWSSVKLTDSNF